ncbi:MAG: anaerobic ribonucleoside-triphosphate reductase [Peptococcaceae bacterium]|nr:anaerobic ribonucleoside-triphosphate reductase [Peptococcaceae bacterium]MDH7524342.1 anaerobic ribonucleoside-triphosphate reductase [Peptococcaceae bacterium]
MFTHIRKRDDRIVPFNESKITDAIFAAAKAVGGEDRQTAVELTLEVMKYLKNNFNGEIFGVEDVQDAVEKVLIERGHARTAKAYILYREKRSRIRDARSELMDAVAEILRETNRENANVGNSPSAKVLQISEVASRNYYLKRVIPEDEARAHLEGDIYIHDLAWYGKTLTCLQIPLDRLLAEGFNNGHGYIRPPKGIKTAAAQAAIILQSNQNDMHGGQSFAYFDRDMAPYVEKEYERQERLLREAAGKLGAVADEEKIKSLAMERTENEVFQAMEGLIYNLNTMHSLSGKERIWIYDKQSGEMTTYSMAEFHEQFIPGRYQALSVNYQTGRTELKDITASFKHKNTHKILNIKFKSGQTVAVTDNHSMIALGDDGSIVTAAPDQLKHGLIPRELVLEKEVIEFDLTKYPSSTKYPLERLRMTPSLAKLMGMYVADGSVNGSTLSLALFDKNLETEAERILHDIHPGFSVRLREHKGLPRDLACNVGQQFAAFLGDKCGIGAENKRIPSELFFADKNIVKAFLDGYISGDGTVGSNRLVVGTVSKELRDGIQLLFCKLGIPVYIREAFPKSQFAKAKKRYLIAIGGFYGHELSLSGEKGIKLIEATQICTEQTPYDYDFLRPFIKEVYGIHCKTTKYYRLKPEILEGIAVDLAKRILAPEEKTQLELLADEEFWLNQLTDALAKIQTTERHYLLKMMSKRKLPRFCKYLPVYYPYKDMLKRFCLSEVVNEKTRSRIGNHCQSPMLVMDWACMVLKQNEKMVSLLAAIERALRLWPMKVKELIELDHEEYVYDVSVEGNENFLTAEGLFVHNSRAGAQVPFSSINLGTDTSWAGRMVTEKFLLALEKGLGKGECAIFPNVIFKVKEGVNYDPDDPNYDLFRLSMRVACKRLQPNFSFQDSSFNAPYRDEEVAYMGCRTRVIANVNGRPVTNGRGNLSFTSINLPRLGLKAQGDLTLFWQYLDEMMNLTIKQLKTRYDLQKKLKVRDFPFLMGQKLCLDSEDLKPDDPIEKAARHGTLSVGFIGLAECLKALTGKHHGESQEAQALGLAIVSYMRRRCDEATRKYSLNYTLLATPAEGLSGKFTRADAERFGVIPGITDKEWYTNSFHVPVEFDITAMEKIAIEGPYHKYCNAGHISYVELPSAPHHNLEAFESLIRAMREADMGYAAVNFPVDVCMECGFNGVIESEICPQCHSAGKISRVRRITGYLSTLDMFNESKRAEERSRKTHMTLK